MKMNNLHSALITKVDEYTNESNFKAVESQSILMDENHFYMFTDPIIEVGTNSRVILQQLAEDGSHIITKGILRLDSPDILNGFSIGSPYVASYCFEDDYSLVVKSISAII